MCVGIDTIFTMLILFMADACVLITIWWHYYLFNTVISSLWVLVAMFIVSVSYGLIFNIVPKLNLLMNFIRGSYVCKFL